MGGPGSAASSTIESILKPAEATGGKTKCIQCDDCEVCEALLRLFLSIDSPLSVLLSFVSFQFPFGIVWPGQER